MQTSRLTFNKLRVNPPVIRCIEWPIQSIYFPTVRKKKPLISTIFIDCLYSDSDVRWPSFSRPKVKLVRIANEIVPPLLFLFFSCARLTFFWLQNVISPAWNSTPETVILLTPGATPTSIQRQPNFLFTCLNVEGIKKHLNRARSTFAS